MSWKARIEFISPGQSTDGIAKVFAVQTLTGSGSTVVSSDPAPSFGGAGRGQARITMLRGAALVAINDVTPVEADSVRLEAGQDPEKFSIAQGQVLSFAEAADTSGSEAPGRVVVKIVATGALANGPCRGLVVGTPGAANLKDLEGNTMTNFPLQQGYNPIGISELTSFGAAADVWAIY